MRVVDLFAGSGGFSLGFTRAGMEVVAAYDFEPDAIAVHAANLPKVLRKGIKPVRLGGAEKHREADLTDLLTAAPDIADLRPDVVVGGPPCQAFSASGKRLGDDDPRARLTEAYAVAVAVSRPRYFVMENVPQAAASAVYRRAMRILKKAGYGISPEIVDMSWYNVGQARKRLVVFGALGEADGWATAYLNGMKGDRRTTVRDVLGDSVGDVFFRMGHRAEDRVSFRSADEPGPTVTTTADRRQTGPDGYVVTKSDAAFLERTGAYFLYPGGSSSAGTSNLDEPSPTLTRRAADAPGPGYKPRPGDVVDVNTLPLLSLEQLAQLAGYPSDWIWHPNPNKPLSKAARMLMIANSVPAPFSEVCARVLLAHSKGEPPAVTLPVELPVGFARWLAGPGGIAKEHVRQRMSEARSAARLLNGREIMTSEDAVRHLHAAPGFQALGKSRRSNLVVALRHLYDYMDKDVRLAHAAAEDLAQRRDDEEPTAPFPVSFRLRKQEPDPIAWEEEDHEDGEERLEAAE